MYLPLAGHSTLNKEDAFQRPLSTTSNLQNVLPPSNAYKARNQKQEHHPEKEKENTEEASSCDQKKDSTEKFYANESMSTQDFIALCNFAIDKKSG